MNGTASILFQAYYELVVDEEYLLNLALLVHLALSRECLLRLR